MSLFEAIWIVGYVNLVAACVVAVRKALAMTTWSRTRIREHNGLPARWNFDGIPVGLIGYRGIDGTPLLLPGPALCEWNRRAFRGQRGGSQWTRLK